MIQRNMIVVWFQYVSYLMLSIVVHLSYERSICVLSS